MLLSVLIIRPHPIVPIPDDRMSLVRPLPQAPRSRRERQARGDIFWWSEPSRPQAPLPRRERHPREGIFWWSERSRTQAPPPRGERQPTGGIFWWSEPSRPQAPLPRRERHPRAGIHLKGEGGQNVITDSKLTWPDLCVCMGKLSYIPIFDELAQTPPPPPSPKCWTDHSRG